MLYIINFMSSDIWYHTSVQPQRWGFYKYFSHKEIDSIQVTVFWSHVGGGRNKVRGEARCLISPLTSFISSPDVLQDVFLVLTAKVLQSGW